MNHWTQEINESMNQWFSESMVQWTSESVNQRINEPMKQWNRQSMVQWTNESVNHRINEPMWNNGSVNPWTHESTNHWITNERLDARKDEWSGVEWSKGEGRGGEGSGAGWGGVHGVEWSGAERSEWMSEWVSGGRREGGSEWATSLLSYLFTALKCFQGTSYVASATQFSSRIRHIAFCNLHLQIRTAKRRTMLKNYIMRSYNAFSNLQLQSGKAGELQDH